MLKVLHVLQGLLRGGNETFVMNVHRNIDRSKIQFDYMDHSEEHQDYEDEVISLGGKVGVLQDAMSVITSNAENFGTAS